MIFLQQLAILFSVVLHSASGNGDVCTKHPLPSSTCKANSSSCYYQMLMGNCISCEPATCTATEGVYFLDLDIPLGNVKFSYGSYFLKASLSCQELNEMVCGALNREGPLCERCQPGYGPPPYSSTGKCSKCSNKYSVSWNWLFYFVLELVPSTAFYIVVVLFSVRTTAPPYTAFVFFSQVFITLYKLHPFIRLSFNVKVNAALLQVLLSVIGFWNLDFFRYIIPPFCVSSELNDLHVVLLECVSGFYPLLLVTLTFVCIELHARNFRPLVILWTPVHKCFTSCRRNLDPKSSLIAAFATFLSLSFSKILFVLLQLTLFGRYYVVGQADRRKMGLYNRQINCNTTTECWQQLFSTPYFIPLLVIVTAVQLPTVLLLLYPIKAFRRLLARCCFCCHRGLYVFMDTFQGHYKDGTNGSRDYRASASISFLLRILISVFLSNDLTRRGVPIQSDYVFMIYIFVGVSLYYAIVQPCKQRYMNVAESIVYSSAALMLLSFGIGGEDLRRKISTSHGLGWYFRLHVSLCLLVLPSLLLFFMLVSKVTICLCCRQNAVLQRARRLPQMLGCKTTDITTDEVPDRVQHPLDYDSIP